MSESLYLSEGKQRFRELLRDLAVRERIRTVGTFYGTGVDSRLFAGAGLDVLAMEKVQAQWPAMDADAAEHGFRVFHGRARKVREHLDMVHADFIGGPSPDNFRELRHIAAITDRLLAVTLSPDHQLDRSMQGESALYTVPAWLTGATGFTIEYFGRYIRNRGGQTMFVAILQRKSGRGVTHVVQPIQIARSIASRRYWASRTLYETGLLAHRYAPETEREKETSREYYLANRERYLNRSRESYRLNHEARSEQVRRWREAHPEAMREARKRWYEAHKSDPAYRARSRARSRAWYETNREKAIEQARQSRLRKKSAAVSSTTAEALDVAA